MGNVAAEYVTDVPYARRFVPDLSPARLRMVAALSGFAPPSQHDFDYCELGCAHGDTTAALAAAHPGARFVGVDFNARHIASAHALAREGQLANVHFVQSDFAALDAEKLPDFDFMTAHGVLSWVSAEKRRAAIAFAAAKLKPGGLLYVSYNALPGWAALSPLRTLIALGGDMAGTGGREGGLERARAGVDFAKRVRDAGALYFAQNPNAREMLDTMEQAGLAYVVHEYLHAHWEPMYFRSVAEELAQGELYFVGQLPLHLNFRDLAVPPSTASLFQTLGDRASFEELKDFALNQFFRVDVFVKGRGLRAATASSDYLDTTTFGTIRSAFVRSVRLPHATLDFSEPIFEALAHALSTGAKNLEALAETGPLRGFARDEIRSALLRLLLGEQIVPMTKATRRTEGELERVRLTPSSPFNRAALGRPWSSEAPIVLASPILGTGVAIASIDGLVLRLLSDDDAESDQERIELARSLLRNGNIRLSVANRPVDDLEEKVRVVMDHLRQLRAERLGTFIELEMLSERQ